MITTAITPPSPEEVLPRWLEELQASDRAKGTIRRYKSAVEGFLVWYSREEQRPLNFSQLSPIALVGYRNYIQRTQQRATSTVNGQISALRAFCAWLTEERYLEVNGVWQGFVPGTAIWTAKVASTSYIILRVYNFFNYTPRACHTCTVLSERAEAINRPSGDQAPGT